MAVLVSRGAFMCMPPRGALGLFVQDAGNACRGSTNIRGADLEIINTALNISLLFTQGRRGYGGGIRIIRIIPGFVHAIPHSYPDFKLSDLPKGVGEQGLISGFAPIPHTLISN